MVMSILLTVVIVVFIIFVVIFYSRLLKIFTKIVNDTRDFLWHNKSLVDIFFLFIYGIIQLFFLFEINKPNPNINLLFTNNERQYELCIGSCNSFVSDLYIDT